MSRNGFIMMTTTPEPYAWLTTPACNRDPHDFGCHAQGDLWATTVVYSVRGRSNSSNGPECWKTTLRRIPDVPTLNTCNV